MPPAAAFYALPQIDLPPGRTDYDYVRGLLQETGILCVHGSGFGMDPAAGYLRIIFLAAPDRLNTYFDQIEGFTATFGSA